MEQCHAPYPCKEDKPCQAKTFLTCECQHRKQEVKCMASKTNPWPQRTTLKCDDECLRLQRNARLASALNIDPQTHQDNHVPYSDTTLKFYRENPKWAEKYEREYRVFASDAAEKRLRFKPMQSHQRAFLHSLAEDFGFDSESSDPEPHRHVCLFKTPRFVSAPAKTLSQCAKIRAAQAPPTSAALAPTGTGPAPKQPYNALLLSSPRFGLTIEEVDAALKSDYAAHPAVKVAQASFLPSDEVVLRASGSWAAPQALEASLPALRTAVAATARRLGLAARVSLCHVDDSLNVLRREGDPDAAAAAAAAVNGKKNADGWNAVIGRSAARPRRAPAPGASIANAPLRSGFVALRREPPKLKKKGEEEEANKRKVPEEPVDEDWEAAAEKLDDEQ
ncbi:hypothetical protein DL766_006737 [Monosporascus sp. MC13-8B]|uniref:R3H domain-containing protein n=1 Tax=Monosporascus cannonballus TaxID=155416 RepID=A0ABY0GVL9_9PEZI|nr:hypothetical protein DL762_008726 [Monosporascus cannonballus]RYP01613.1 hypothetical protein DL763_000002 [Monosporascus cannonballus]RYP26388.1 hypothetical protein DL766_006737 [Monosporascus sp. MC13-8B]